MVSPIREISTFRDGSFSIKDISGSRPNARVVWDDENPDYNYKSRTQQSGWDGPPNPPAVLRYYKEPKDKSGDFRVDMESPYNWKPTMIAINGGSEKKFNYVIQTGLALYNTGGWAKQAYLVMSGNLLQGEFIGDWFKFITLKQSDVEKASLMTNATHPQFIMNFTCVTWDSQNKITKRITSTGTQHGNVYYCLVTVDGVGWIPKRHVVPI